MNKALTILKWTLVALLAMVLLVLVLIYTPFVQDWAKDFALEKVNQSTGMTISADKLRITFPADIQLQDAVVVDAAGDTMVVVGRADVSARLLPLLGGDIKVDDVCAENVRYRLNAPDSALYLTAQVDQACVSSATLDLASALIDVDEVSLDGGRVHLALGEDTVATPDSGEEAAKWLIKVSEANVANVDYSMTMLPIIESLHAHVGDAMVCGAIVDMTRSHIGVESVAVDSVSARYFTPCEVVGQEVVIADEANETDSQLWTIEVASVQLRNSDAVYAMAEYEPGEGLDLDYLNATNISFTVDSFFNRGSEIRVPLRQLAATERCGVGIEAHGLFAMDSALMRADGFVINTPHSALTVDAEMGMGDMTADEHLPLKLLVDGKVGIADLALAYPVMKPAVHHVRKDGGIDVDVDIAGTMARLDVKTLSVNMARQLSLNVNGSLAHVMKPDSRNGHIAMSGYIANAAMVEAAVLDKETQKLIDLPPMSIDGEVVMSGSKIDGTLEVLTGNGEVALDADWNGRGNKYDLKLRADSFPVDAFMPDLEIGMLIADVTIKGEGFDYNAPETQMNANIDLSHFEYKGRSYSNARAWATLDSCRFDAGIESLNPDVDFDITASSYIRDDAFDWTILGDVRNADLLAVGLSDSRSKGALKIKGEGSIDVKRKDYKADVTVNGLQWSMSGMSVATRQLKAMLNANDSLMKVSVKNDGLNADFIALCSVDTFVSRVMKTVEVLDSQIVRRQIDVLALQSQMPRFSARMEASGNNVLASVLASSDMSARTLSLSAHNDSLFNIRGDVSRLVIGETRLDSVSFSALQHGRFLAYQAMIGNDPGTMDQFAHVDLNGYIAYDKISAFVKQRNIEQKQGFNLGAIASIGDSVVNVKLVPLAPVIGYKKWSLNRDNFIDYNFYTHHLDGNVQLIGEDSHLKLFTEHINDGHMHQEDVVLNVYNLQLDQLLKVSPYAPPVKGSVSADMRFAWDESSVKGRGSVSLVEMYLGRDRVGSFDLGVDLATSKSGLVTANASLLVDNVKTITVAGSLNDTTKTSPVSLDLSMIRFPLKVVNPFLPRNTARLSGMLNGQMAISGDLSSPRFDGYVAFDSTQMLINIIGSTFSFSNEKVPVTDNVVRFDNYAINGANQNPLTIDGRVDVGDLLSPQIDLSLKARNMQFMNSTKGKGTDIYGKGYMDLDATVKGDLSLLNVDATVDLLGGSNITYIMADASTSLMSQNTGEMVRFVEFADTVKVETVDEEETSSMAMNLDAKIIVSGGTTINVDLSADGKNRVQLQGSGMLNYTMNNMDDSRFTGRYTIDKGFMRYTPPLMSEKLFNFREGSYVAFNGDMLNPILSIYADDQIKANVTREGQDSRLVNFDVSLAVTNTLSNMDVAFDLSTNEDITIQNELQSMSAEQRANQAMNMLLYNVYTGPGTKTDVSANPLYSFLESQINTWAANNIKFVDVSFGIDQYDKTAGGDKSTATSYSYKVSKTLFDDRFKIVIGGNYSTDADADEDVTQNLVNDISFEYMLNRSGSMYVKVFRHVGYESVLEGEVTQTGVGFVYKRKLHSLKDLFRWGESSAQKRQVATKPEEDAKE